MARGAAYPYIGLQEAVNLTRKVYDFSKRSPANLATVVKEQWKYSPTSSSSQKIVAALRYFGLAEVQGGGAQSQPETIKITDRAFRILVDSADSPERKKAIVDAFMDAKAYKLCWNTWGADMPPAMRSTLIFSHGFHESSVDGFLKDYRKSVEFAGLVEANGGIKHDPEHSGAGKTTPTLGDFVQWEHDGVLGLPKPLKLVKLSEDGAFGWLEGHTAGSALPVAELVMAEPPPPVTPPPAVALPPPSLPPAPAPLVAARGHAESRAIPPKGVGMRQEVFSLTEGDVTIQWPERIGKESLQDFLDWWPILKRKVERSLVVDVPKLATNNPPDGAPPQ